MAAVVFSTNYPWEPRGIFWVPYQILGSSLLLSAILYIVTYWSRTRPKEGWKTMDAWGFTHYNRRRYGQWDICGDLWVYDGVIFKSTSTQDKTLDLIVIFGVNSGWRGSVHEDDIHLHTGSERRVKIIENVIVDDHLFPRHYTVRTEAWITE